MDKKSYAQVRRAVWEMHMGVGVQSAKCILCNTYVVSVNVNSGFEACHIVARCYMSEERPLTRFDLVPGCNVCNNECRDMCLLDYLFVRSRSETLRRVVRTICRCFLEEHGAALLPYQRMGWRILERLYGTPTGGIQNSGVYAIARADELEQMTSEIVKCTRKLEDLVSRMNALASTQIPVPNLLM